MTYANRNVSTNCMERKHDSIVNFKLCLSRQSPHNYVDTTTTLVVEIIGTLIVIAF